jgi:hypothetical protein
MENVDNKFERIDFDGDPERCQSVSGGQQCPYKGKIGPDGKRSKNCPRHTPGMTGRSHVGSPDPVRNYRFSTVFQPTVDHFAGNEKIKSLREEIGLMRMLLQTIVNRCKDQYELTMEADRLAKLVDQINKLVQSCHKIEEATGTLLDKTVVINIGAMMVNILERHVPDKAVLDLIGAEIYEAIEKSSSRETPLGAGAEQYHNGV